MEWLKGNDWTPINYSIKDSEDLTLSIKNNILYFPLYKNAYSHKASPLNLGICQIIDKDGTYKLHSTQYIGIMPRLPQEGTIIGDKDACNMMVTPRFSISPVEMLKAVLAGNDYYDNPSILSYKSYSLSELQQLGKRSNDSSDEQEKVLFGRVHGVGRITLDSRMEIGKKTPSKPDLDFIQEYGIFEILDFIKKTTDLCKKGVKKMSERIEENLTCKVKGRILIHKQIKYNEMRGQSQKMYCAYNKLSEDIRENQILKYALYLCERYEIGSNRVSDAMMEDIMFCKRALADVPLKKCTMGSFAGLKNNGAYRHYKDALNAAKQIIGRYEMTFSRNETEDRKGTNDEQKESGKVTIKNFTVDPFFIDMNYLFELYCRAVLRKAIERFNGNKTITFSLEPQQYAERRLFGEEGDKLDDFFMNKYIPDMVLMYKKGSESEKVAAVLDAKWSDLANNKGNRRSRTHQIMFYMAALDCDIGCLMGMSGDKEQEKGKNIPVFDVKYNYSVAKGNTSNGDNTHPKKLCAFLLTDNATENQEKDAYGKDGESTTVFDHHVREMNGLLEDIAKIIEKGTDK